MPDKNPTVIFLMGPTASGKSALAFALAEKLPVEIISVDATQVYRGLDIGSAKPSADEQQRVAHHLIDIRDPAETYSVAEFREDALQAVNSIIHRQKIPLLVGGSMLYFNVLLNGLAKLPAADADIRADIEQQAATLGWPAMHQKLAAIDPESAARLHPNHSQRIARALEVFHLTGQTLSELHRQQQLHSEGLQQAFAIYQFALIPKRERLHELIAERFAQMLAQGFVEEVRALQMRHDLNLQLPSIRSVGYRQVWSYLAGDYQYDEMVAKGKAATRQLAKRQVTWLRSWQDLHVLSMEDNFGKARSASQICEQALNTLPAVPI